MVTLTINRKPQGIFSKSPATPLQDKTNTAHNVKARERIPQLNDKLDLPLYFQTPVIT